MENLNNIMLYCADCMDIMQSMPDKAFDLAIVYPPYGIDKDYIAYSRIRRYGQMRTVNDEKPTREYFNELFRVSRNQIIWGYNHLSDMLPTTKEFIFWYKHQPVISYSNGELAWTSFRKTAKCFDYRFFGGTGKDSDGRIHPTQKPVALYSWLLKNYAQPGDKILDTHGGSMSIAIACHDSGHELTVIEKDPDYYAAARKRRIDHQAQIRLF